jgi:hypothetical protein
MTETALGLIKAGSFQVPALIADIGPDATKRYFEFFYGSHPEQEHADRLLSCHWPVPGLVPARRLPRP